MLNENFDSMMSFSKPIGPLESSDMELLVAANLLPAGSSYLEYDLIQEGNKWAKDAGGKTCVIKVVK